MGIEEFGPKNLQRRIRMVSGWCWRKAVAFVLLVVLAAPLSFAGSYDETASVSRVVGESPTEMLRQLQRDELNMRHASLFASSDEQKAQEAILGKQFGKETFIPGGWSVGMLDSSVKNMKRNDLLLLQTGGGASPLHATSTAVFDKKITPAHVATNWQLSFEENNPLLLWDSPYAGAYLPKEDTLVSRLVRDSTIIAPASFNSPQFVTSFLCKLASDKTIGQVFRETRNFHYNGGSQSGRDNVVGLVLQSYGLYGNPRQVIKMDWTWENQDALKKKYCKNNLENLAAGIEFLEQVGNYSKFRKHLSFQIENYTAEQVGNFSILTASNAFQRTDLGELVLPFAVRTTSFPKNTIITNMTLDGVGRPVNATIPNLPSYEYEFGLVNRSCLQDNASYNVQFENGFTESSTDVIARIAPVELLNCTAGSLQLYTEFNYSVDYIALSPALVKHVDAPAIAHVGEPVMVGIELIRLTETPVNSSLSIADESGRIVWEAETSTAVTAYNASFYPLEDEGLHSYSAEFIYDNETAHYVEFAVFSAILDVKLAVPVSVPENGSVNFTFTSFSPLELLAHYYLMHNGTLLAEGNFTQPLQPQDNPYTHNLSFAPLSRANQSYTLTLELDYLGQKRALSYLLNTNNAPLLLVELLSEYREQDEVVLNITAIDYDNDAVLVSVNDSRFIKSSGNAFVWSTSKGDSGDYDVLVTASDGLLESSQDVQFRIGKRLGTQPSIPTALFCNGAPCTNNSTFYGSVTVNCSGSVDADSDAITYIADYNLRDSPLWATIGNHSDSGLFVWNISGLGRQSGIALRCSAVDLYDTGIASDYYAPSMSLLLTDDRSEANKAPEIVHVDVPAVSEGSSATFAVDAIDEDGDDLSYSWLINGTVVSSEKSFVFAPAYNESSDYNISVRVSDGFVVVERSFTVTVADTMECAPGPGPGSAMTRMCALQEGVCSGSVETCSGEAKWPGCSVETYTAHNRSYEPNETSCDTFDNDCDALVDEDHACNAPPVFVGMENVTAYENDTILFKVRIADEDSDVMYLNVSALPPGSEFNETTLTFTWRPGFDQAGLYAVEFNATDMFATVEAAVNITVLNRNRPPVIINLTRPSGNVTAGTNASFTAAATDADEDELSFAWLVDGNVTARGSPVFVYSPGTADVGQHIIAVEVSDGNASVTAEVAVNVAAACTDTGFADLGTVSVGSRWKTVHLQRKFEHPVVIAKALSTNGRQPAHVRLKGVNATAFMARVEEWDYLDDKHALENVSYLVMNAGSYSVDGKKVVAGLANVTDKPARVNFRPRPGFGNAVPVVFSQLQTVRGSQAAIARNANVSSTGFRVRVQEEENSSDNGRHVAELIGFIAAEPGSYPELGNTYVGVADGVTHRWSFLKLPEKSSGVPLFIADMQTLRGADPASLRYRNLSASSVQLRVQEEQSKDKEMFHAPEQVGFLTVPKCR